MGEGFDGLFGRGTEVVVVVVVVDVNVEVDGAFGVDVRVDMDVDGFNGAATGDRVAVEALLSDEVGCVKRCSM